MLVTDSWSLFSEKAPDYPHRIAANLIVDGLPYSGNVDVLLPGSLFYVNGTRTDDGQVVLQALPRKYAAYQLCLLIMKEGRPYASELIIPDNVVVYDLAISTSGGGGAPTGDPATLTGKVERVLAGTLSELSDQCRWRGNCYSISGNREALLMATTNIWQQFRALIPEGVRVIATITAHNGNGTSQAELRDGSVITVRGESVAVGEKAIMQNGEVKGPAPGLAQYEVIV